LSKKKGNTTLRRGMTRCASLFPTTVIRRNKRPTNRECETLLPPNLSEEPQEVKIPKDISHQLKKIH
jgi:hypothetical protein